MVRISQQVMQQHFQRGENASTTTEKGRALEDLICYVFGKVPGIEITMRNSLNAFNTEEIDVALWNAKTLGGIYFLPHILLIECKNWSNPVGSAEVSYFISRLQNRGVDHGILIAVSGITGNSTELTDANFQIATALSKGTHIIVISKQELTSLRDTGNLVKLIKEKLCELAVSGTVLLPA